MNLSCDLPGAAHTGHAFPDPVRDLPSTASEATAVLAGGCFWCTEAVYRQLDGVLDVTAGYAGDSAATADYKTVCSGTTDHAEVIRIKYDPKRLSYGQLLKVFFSAAHDPTQRDRQGNDMGRQYRSAIFYATPAERDVALAYIDQLDVAKVFAQPIATTLEALKQFFPAEDYHQDYAARNPNQPYIASVASPKVQKVRKLYGDRLVKS